MSLEYRPEEPELEPAEDDRVLNRADPRVAYYSYVLIACILAVYVVQWYVDGGPNGRHSIPAAGFNPDLARHGELWRILTSAALHGSITHIFFNSYAVYVLGRQFEILSARAHLAIVFILSVIGGAMPGMFAGTDHWSVGASGGIVGFLGYLAVYGWRRRELIPDSFRKNMVFNIGLMLFFGIAVNASGGGVRVDNWAHIGGLVTGAIYGFFQIPGDLYKDPRVESKTLEIIGLAALGTFIATCLFTAWLMLR